MRHVDDPQRVPAAVTGAVTAAGSSGPAFACREPSRHCLGTLAAKESSTPATYTVFVLHGVDRALVLVELGGGEQVRRQAATEVVRADLLGGGDEHQVARAGLRPPPA